jgi:hypothetical protein
LKLSSKLRGLPFFAARGEDAKPYIYRLINVMLDRRHILTSSGDTLNPYPANVENKVSS